MKKTTLFFIFLFVSISVFATKGKTESDTTLIATKDTAVVKKEFKQYRNFIGLDLLGSPLKISYAHYFKNKKYKTQFGFVVGLNPVFLFPHGIPGLSVSLSARYSVAKKMLLYAEIGTEFVSLIYPVKYFNNVYDRVNFNKNKLYLGFVDISTNFSLGFCYSYKRLLYVPLFIKSLRNYPAFFNYDGYWNKHSAINLGTSINFQF